MRNGDKSIPSRCKTCTLQYQEAREICTVRLGGMAPLSTHNSCGP
jgi:hypothetical protein